jgi:DNA-binding NarL/FixJ family response regulator
MPQAKPAFKLFVVEDSALLRSRIEAMLGSIPGCCAVGHAARADEAIDGILATGPDAVLLDIQLEQGSGFDVLRALRERGIRVETYVLTNYADSPYRRVAERLGASGFFDKSTEFDRLHAALTARAAR